MAQLGKYHLVRKLAVGGMGEVWLARQKGVAGFEKLVVLKTLLGHLKEDQEFVNMFFDEARIAAALTHPNIAQIYDLGDDAGEYYIAMEYVHGFSLRDVLVKSLEDRGDMPLGLKCRVVADAAAALEFAHHARSPSGGDLQLIHRDVSPQNILVAFNGAVKLIDFGVAKAANKLSRTATGIIKGKYAYMSPEQAYGEELDARSDVFGLGTVLWETLTCDRLFKRESETETLKAVVGAPIAAPSTIEKSVPKSLDAIVLKALARDRKERYQTAGEMQRALEGFVAKQRLPSTSAHLAAYVSDLFPDEAQYDFASAEKPMEVTDSTGDSMIPLEPARGNRPATKVLEASELSLRIRSLTEAHVMRGMFFNALLAGVLRLVGPVAERDVRNAASEPRPWVDALSYPTADFLRLLWKAVEMVAPRCRNVDEAFEQLGLYTMDALLRSPFGKSLSAMKGKDVQQLLKPLLDTLNAMIQPGSRVATQLTAGKAVIVFKEEVVPIQLYVGLLRSICSSFYALGLDAAWDKPAAERIELTLQW